jgi:hypothetical protein
VSVAVAYSSQGDFPTKKLLLWRLMRQLGDTGIENPKLRDEIFCQIIKQITNNESEYVSRAFMITRLVALETSLTLSDRAHRPSLLRGWEILAIVCGLYQPGRDLLPYLQALLAKFAVVPKHVNDDEPRADIGRLARAALINLGRIKRHGNRKFATSSFEFESVRVRLGSFAHSPPHVTQSMFSHTGDGARRWASSSTSPWA